MGKIKFDHYFTSSEEGEILHDLHKAYPELMQFQSICKTPGGRDIWAVEITNPKTGPMESKPAFHVDGCTHAGELTGSMCAMYYIDYLLENYGKLPEVTKLVDDYALYIVPCISPDGMDTVLLTDQQPRSVNRPFPKDVERHGLHPKDLDGDGFIRQMRIRSPYGAWKISAKDPRFLEHRKPDEIGGEYYNVYMEGEYIGHYDKAHISLARHQWDYDFNRNFPVAWDGDAVQSGAGEYPLCNPETKAMVDYILARKNISAVVTGHTCGGMFLYPPGPFPESEADRADMDLYHAMAKIGYEETGFPVANLNTVDMKMSMDILGYPKFSHGAFDDWMYVEQGILATTIEFWDVGAAAGLAEPRFDQNGFKDKSMDETVADWNQIVDWIERTCGEGAVKPWTKFDHPQLGEVEIGGIDMRFCTQNPPPALLEEEILRATRYYVRYGLSVPKLAFSDVEAKKESDGIYRVTVVVANTGYMPTYGTHRALEMHKADEIAVEILAPEGVLEGGAQRKIGHLEGFSAIMSRPRANFMTLGHKPCARSVSWLVYGNPGDAVTITAHTPRAGTASATVKL